MKISIHAAGEGGDAAIRIINQLFSQFQSTPPVRAATNFIHVSLFTAKISIHAAGEGGDLSVVQMVI